MGMDESEKVRQISDTTAMSSVGSCQQGTELTAHGVTEKKKTSRSMFCIYLHFDAKNGSEKQNKKCCK